MEQKRKGRIRHLGFSCHGEMDVLRRFLEAYGKDLEFCQLQVNYLDWKFQHAAEKVALCEEYGLPVWVMEPLRGGSLCKLTEQQAAKLDAMRPGVSAAEWSFRFLQSQPQITLVLSGSSTLEQMQENLKIFDREAPLREGEQQALMDVADDMIRHTAVPCTACHYCTDHCPKQLDIPRLLALYNQFESTDGPDFIAPFAIHAMPEDKRPSACIACGSCAKVCPQQIHIPDELATFDAKMQAQAKAQAAAAKE